MNTTETVDIDSLDTAKPLTEIFQPFEVTLAKWEQKAESLVVTRLDQKQEMAEARMARLELKAARVEMDKTRKKLTEKLKARTSAIDGAARTIREKLELLEEKLLDSELFAERHASKLKAETRCLRESELWPFMDTPILGDLSDLSAADYATVLQSAKAVQQARLEAATKAKVEVAAKAKAEQEERERLKLENEKLRKANEAAEAEARKEKLRLQALAEVERQKAQALRMELEQQERAEAEERNVLRRQQEQEALAKRKAANAPDKEKLLALSKVVMNLEIPQFSISGMSFEVKKKLTETANWLTTTANAL